MTNKQTKTHFQPTQTASMPSRMIATQQFTRSQLDILIEIHFFAKIEISKIFIEKSEMK